MAAAVALEAINIYEERNIVDWVRNISPALQDGLRRFSDHPLVGEVRGIGLISGIELVKDKETKAPFEAKLGVGTFMQDQAQDEGLIIRSIGDTIAVCPPLIIDEDEIEELLGCLEKAFGATWAWVKDNGLVAA